MIIYQLKQVDAPPSQVQAQEQVTQYLTPPVLDRIRAMCGVHGYDYNEVVRALNRATINRENGGFQVLDHNETLPPARGSTESTNRQAASAFAIDLIRGAYGAPDNRDITQPGSLTPDFLSPRAFTFLDYFHNNSYALNNNYSRYEIPREQQQEIIREARRLGITNNENEESALFYAIRGSATLDTTGREFSRGLLNYGIERAVGNIINSTQRKRILDFAGLIVARAHIRPEPDFVQGSGNRNQIEITRDQIHQAKLAYMQERRSELIAIRQAQTGIELIDRALNQMQERQETRNELNQIARNASLNPVNQLPPNLRDRVLQRLDGRLPINDQMRDAIRELTAMREDLAGQDRAAVTRAIDELSRARRTALG